MKTVSYDGVAAITTDEVADALLAFALVAARFSSYEAATIPVAGAVGTERLTLMLGPTIHLSTLSTSAVLDVEIEGAVEAAAELRYRAEHFTEPLLPFGSDGAVWESGRPGPPS